MADRLFVLLKKEEFKGILVSDDATVYQGFSRAQKCWAHQSINGNHSAEQYCTCALSIGPDLFLFSSPAFGIRIKHDPRMMNESLVKHNGIRLHAPRARLFEKAGLLSVAFLQCDALVMSATVMSATMMSATMMSATKMTAMMTAMMTATKMTAMPTVEATVAEADTEPPAKTTAVAATVAATVAV